MSSDQQKRLNKLVADLKRQGWEVIHTRKGHPRLKSPEGRVVQIPSSPGDPMTFMLTEQKLRKLGAEIPRPYDVKKSKRKR